MDTITPDAEAFWRDGYVVAENLVTAETCTFLRQCMDISQRAGQMCQKTENPVYNGPNNEYAPAAGQRLLDSLTPKMTALVGKELLPSYAFWRIYEQGAVLHRHTDRLACEVSVTISLAAEPVGDAWPIGITDLSGKDHHIALGAGSALLYQGTQVPHWRDALIGDRQYQLFLHYVIAGGPFADMANEGGQAQPHELA